MKKTKLINDFNFMKKKIIRTDETAWRAGFTVVFVPSDIDAEWWTGLMPVIGVTSPDCSQHNLSAYKVVTLRISEHAFFFLQ